MLAIFTLLKYFKNLSSRFDGDFTKDVSEYSIISFNNLYSIGLIKDKIFSIEDFEGFSIFFLINSSVFLELLYLPLLL